MGRPTEVTRSGDGVERTVPPDPSDPRNLKDREDREDPNAREDADDPALTTERTANVDELIGEYDEERPGRRLSPRLDHVLTAVCFAVSMFVLYQVFSPLRQGGQYYLILFLAAVLPLVFVCYRATRRRGARTRTTQPDGSQGDDNPGILDWALAALALIVCLYPVQPFTIGDGGGGFNAFLDRQGSLGAVDVAMGTLLMLLILEACRRTTGLVLPIVCAVFFAFAYYGGFLPVSWTLSHAGMNFGDIINGFYNDASGFFGIPLDVAATYIVLFTIYGAVLEATGASRFFIDISFAAFRKSSSAPGRTVALSGFLLGTVSGSGTATAVSLGSVSWPILKKAGYPREAAGGMLAAAGIGAILSPPTLGAAAFIIAEYLGVNYLQVLFWATVPTLLYYLGIILAVEMDARKFGAHEVHIATRSALQLLLRFGYHFLSLFVIVAFLALGIPPFKAVVYATAVAALFGLVERLVSGRDPLDPDAERCPLPEAMRLYAVELYRGLAMGVRSVLPVASVCAAAGIITSVIVKTGIGQSLASMLVSAAQAITSNETGVLVLTAVFAAVAIAVLGLAVPVTASFIIAWVVIGPALQTLGVSAPETAMFIFYYAVLSEVSPPTALAAVAASAITGGDAIKTMWHAWKYTLPAFLAPLAFVITDNGSHLLMQGDVLSIIWTTLVSMLAVAALALVTGGWLFGPVKPVVRALCIPAAGLLLYLQPFSIGVGLVFLVAAVALAWFTKASPRHTPTADARTTTLEEKA
ncbi:TRAP transporter fused permease subunit [Knoellia locipacati]|uniref:TRAP transporter permease n=1 Tax=Knoellia locipacati TaxID=882824 RepID=UPI00384AD5EC